MIVGSDSICLVIPSLYAAVSVSVETPSYAQSLRKPEMPSRGSQGPAPSTTQMIPTMAISGSSESVPQSSSLSSERSDSMKFRETVLPTITTFIRQDLSVTPPTNKELPKKKPLISIPRLNRRRV